MADSSTYARAFLTYAASARESSGIIETIGALLPRRQALTFAPASQGMGDQALHNSASCAMNQEFSILVNGVHG